MSLSFGDLRASHILCCSKPKSEAESNVPQETSENIPPEEVYGEKNRENCNMFQGSAFTTSVKSKQL